MKQTNTSAKAPLWQVVFSLFYLLISPVILFFLAGDWRWTEGWIFSIIFCSLSYTIVIYLYVKDPALLNERFGPPVQKGQKSWDKIWLSSFFLGFLVWFAIMPLDAKRFGWSPEFPLWTKIIGTLLFILAFIILFNALKENTFAAPVVKMQKERGQRVISTGLVWNCAPPHVFRRHVAFYRRTASARLGLRIGDRIAVDYPYCCPKPR